jgi:hypothetical protein
MGAPRDMKAVVDLKTTDIDTYIAGVAGRVDLRPMLTHTFRLQQWRGAFLAIANQGESGVVSILGCPERARPSGLTLACVRRRTVLRRGGPGVGRAHR